MYGWMDGCACACLDGWMDEWIDVYVHEMDGCCLCMNMDVWLHVSNWMDV